MLRDHMPTVAMLVALAMLLVTLLAQALSRSANDGPLLIGLGGAVTTIVGAIAGKQISAASNPAPTPEEPKKTGENA